MDRPCQDWNTIVFNSKKNKQKKEKDKEIEKRVSQKVLNSEDVKIVADKKLGQILSQARIAKGINKQSDFVIELNKVGLNISVQIYSKWESNKEIPTNEQIAKMEKVLSIKLPRNKKVKVNEN
jgi:ribosome-binding protein aMBF1 (putative translation factor)